MSKVQMLTESYGLCLAIESQLMKFERMHHTVVQRRHHLEFILSTMAVVPIKRAVFNLISSINLF